MRKYQIENMRTGGKLVWFVDRWVGDGWKNLAVLNSEDEAKAFVTKLAEAA